tara:strand:- start:61 stop:432 length:372 start_codon:yes stop_codon:yes gene_type:complete
MSESPINFSFARAAAGAVRGGKNARISKLENQMKTIMRDRNKNYDMSADMEQPQFDQFDRGSLADNLANDQLAQQGIAPLGGFGAGTRDAAGAMFGTDIPGSFDKNMGSPLNINKQKKDNEKI